MAITCFGELLLRLTPPASQLLVQASQLDVVVGGAEANVAAALATLGHAVRFVGLAPANALGDRAVTVLRGTGVDTRFIARAPGRMGLYFLENGGGLRPSSITYDRAGSAFAEALPGAIDFRGALSGSQLLHTGGITPALGPKGVALARAAQAAARDAGVPICFDGNYRSQLWSAWDSQPAQVLRELVADATILIGNHRDISLLLDTHFGGDDPESRRRAAQAAFAAFPRLQLIASTVRDIVTGEHHRLAARLDTRNDAQETAAVDITGIVDRIGTGDAFAAGVLHGWLEHSDLATLARHGLALAALKHSVPGDMCLLDRNALAAFSATGGDVRR
ncbi:MAG: hypothetical protein RL026_608 [Pseudomonadota bacterium]|jgi:2-dehydro-3-deoxygluconokinase